MPFSKIPSPRPDDGASLRVFTYNIYGTNAGWEQRREVLTHGLRELDPDLIAFQETLLSGEWDQVVDLLGGQHHIVHSEKRQVGEIGVSIASRWLVERVEELDLHVTPRTEEFPCTTLIAEIATPDPIGRVLLVNHFPDYQPNHEHEREVQTVGAARRIEELVAGREMHVVLAGDLDAEPDAASIRFLTGKQSLDGMSVCYRNAWDSKHPGEDGHTFMPRNALVTENNWDWPFRRIDHILVRCGPRNQPTLKIDACELAFGEAMDGIWGSDHIAVVADLKVP